MLVIAKLFGGDVNRGRQKKVKNSLQDLRYRTEQLLQIFSESWKCSVAQIITGKIKTELMFQVDKLLSGVNIMAV